MDSMMNQISGMTTIILIASLGITVLGLLFAFRVFGGLMRNAKANKDVLTNGIPAQARILSLGETGITVNNNPAVDIVMEVQLPNQAPYQARQRMVVSILRLAQIQPGAVVPVKYDPNDLTKVAIAL